MWNIEHAAKSDFLAIAALDRLAWRHTGLDTIADGEHVWRVWCEYATLLVARQTRDERLAEVSGVGGALVMFPTTADELFLHKIMVHPATRGQGLGTALMRAALAGATRTVLLTVDPANSSAVKLYANFGFRVRETVRGYYRDHEHRHVMERVAASS